MQMSSSDEALYTLRGDTEPYIGLVWCRTSSSGCHHPATKEGWENMSTQIVWSGRELKRSVWQGKVMVSDGRTGEDKTSQAPSCQLMHPWKAALSTSCKVAIFLAEAVT